MGPCSPRCRCQDGQPRFTLGGPRQDPDRHRPTAPRPALTALNSYRPNRCRNLSCRPRRCAAPLKHLPLPPGFELLTDPAAGRTSTSLPDPAPAVPLNRSDPLHPQTSSSNNPKPDPFQSTDRLCQTRSHFAIPTLVLWPLTPLPHNRVGAGSGARATRKRRPRAKWLRTQDSQPRSQPCSPPGCPQILSSCVQVFREGGWVLAMDPPP